MQHHRRDHKIEAAWTEGQSESVTANMLDFRQSMRTSGGAGDCLAMAVERDDVERAADLARPVHQPQDNVAAAAAHIENPELARWEPRGERGEIDENAWCATAEAVRSGQLVKRLPSTRDGSAEFLRRVEA